MYAWNVACSFILYMSKNRAFMRKHDHVHAFEHDVSHVPLLSELCPAWAMQRARAMNNLFESKTNWRQNTMKSVKLCRHLKMMSAVGLSARTRSLHILVGCTWGNKWSANCQQNIYDLFLVSQNQGTLSRLTQWQISRKSCISSKRDTQVYVEPEDARRTVAKIKNHEQRSCSIKISKDAPDKKQQLSTCISDSRTNMFYVAEKIQPATYQ